MFVFAYLHLILDIIFDIKHIIPEFLSESKSKVNMKD